MKTITPSLVSRLGLGVPSLNFNRKGIMFNKSASALLALNSGSRFVLCSENDQLFYQDTPDTRPDAFQVNYLRNGVAVCVNKGIHTYLHPDTQESVNYELGSFENDLRQLTKIRAKANTKSTKK